MIFFFFLKGLVFYLKPLSKIMDSVNNERFSNIITAMLEGKDSSVLTNIEELKVKAILEYRKGMIIDYIFKTT